jgi:hypothetical protein
MENKILLPSKRFLLASDEDVFLDVNLEQNHKLMPIDTLQKTVSSYEVYLDERSKSFDYRVYGNIFLVGTNILCDFDGINGYESVVEAQYYDPETELYRFTLDQVLINDNGWYFYKDNILPCNRTELEPKKERFDLIKKDEWSLFVTYAAEKNVQPLFFNGIDIKDGIALMGAADAEVDGKVLSFFACPLTHNLAAGDSVNIYNQNGFVKKCTVYQVGTADNGYKKNVFFVDEKIDFISNVMIDKYRFKKVVGEVESEYYSRWYKKLTSLDDYDAFRTSFSKNIYNDTNVSFVYPEGVDIEGLVDNLNRPLTELFVTVVKNKSSDFWGETLSAINVSISDINYDFNKVYQGGILNPVETLTTTQDLFFGNIVEYNKMDMLEVELNFAVHLFNTQNRLDNTLYESYYYKPHYRYQIKDLSEIIFKEDGLLTPPDYAETINLIKQWRAITNTDGYPYLNKHHYVYCNFNVFIKRQDPCDRYDIGSNALIAGKCIDLTPSKITNIEKIC